ncbi:hypothetical protein TNCV_4951971 [Trichonephila clavipes]|nr:hypothetical protein TNCV_4951971 [Trichonephila clavipes]
MCVCRFSFGVVTRGRPVLQYLITLPSSWNRSQSLEVTLWAIPSSSDSSFLVRPHSSHPIILPRKKLSKCLHGAIKCVEKKNLSLQKASDLLQILSYESSDAVTDDSSDEEAPVNNLLEFSLDSKEGDQEIRQDSRCSSLC